MQKEEVKESPWQILSKHEPRFDSWDCDLCGYHVTTRCRCGWESEPRGSYSDWWEHIKEVMESI